MHPSLCLENLSALPFSVRRVALAAAGGSRSDWAKVTGFIRADPGVAAHKFLPVIYAVLNRQLVPGPPSETFATNLGSLMPAMDAIGTLHFFTGLSVPILEALWPRVWIWMDLLEKVQFALNRGWTGNPELLNLLWPFIEVQALKSLVHSTPGIHALFGRLFLRSSPLALREDNAIVGGFQFIADCDANCGPYAREFIEECGDDPSALASILVRHVNTIASEYRHPKTQVPRADLLLRLHTFSSFARILGTVSLFPPLLSAGMVKAQTIAISHLNSWPKADAALTNSLDLLSTLLVYSDGSPHLPEALKAGLLGTILSFGSNYQPNQRSVATLDKFLRVILPGSLVSYRVVLALASAYPMVMGRPHNPRLIASPIYSAWQEFETLLQPRLRLLEYFHSEEFIQTKACGNLECDVIRKACELKRCAGCREQCYCSRLCQIADWQGGGHRDSCKVSTSPDFKWTKRDDAFMRLTLHRDYQTNKVDLLMQYLTYMFSNTGPHVFWATFNYSSGRCAVAARPPFYGSSVPENDSLRQFGFTDRQIVAALRAGPRLALHLVIMHGTRHNITLPYILRSNSPELAMGLEEIRTFMEKTDDQEEARRRLQVLCEGEMLETHG
ncbi:hypothetical protein DFH06DRAFT_1475285 [Mycena polygramma]|nr:hypothetical protein DFH06DRAFT_1475285 [Mycena polygramma]